MKTIGILSDTHLQGITPGFLKRCQEAFSHCDAIIHAGDITDLSILSIFADREVFAVYGNMCNLSTKQHLPIMQRIAYHGFSIGIIHGTGTPYNIEDRVYLQFPDADCIVFGHSHVAKIQKIGSTLLINPGCFMGTGKHGAPGSYALLRVSETGPSASLHFLSE